MKSRKIQDKWEITFDDGSMAQIESEFKATVYDCENTASEAYRYVNTVNVSHKVQEESIVDYLLSALEKCKPEGKKDSEANVDDDPTWFGLG